MLLLLTAAFWLLRLGTAVFRVVRFAAQLEREREERDDDDDDVGQSL